MNNLRERALQMLAELEKNASSPLKDSPQPKEPVDNSPGSYNSHSTDNFELLQFLREYKKKCDAKSDKMKEISTADAIISKTSKQKLFGEYEVPSEIEKQNRLLPIYSKKHELMQLIKSNQVVIVVGQNVGKSTQIPQYIVEAGLVTDGSMIGISQPHRVAVKSLAKRVALECGVELGTYVGFAVRFESCVSSSTVIKYMTDGLLVKNCTQDEPNLESYSVVMIDEAHERGINTDVSLGLLKRVAVNRPELKIIISSATLNVAKFYKFFNDAPVFSITGNCYDVEVIYEPSNNYLKDVVDVIMKIHNDNVQAKGDILVFLTGQQDIAAVGEELRSSIIEKHKLPLVVVPFYGTLPFEDQQKIFETTPGYRKIVLATNLAETSLTIDGIVSVIDCGYVKQKRRNALTKIETLVKIPISKMEAFQRQQRAGRTQPGKCYRLYSEEAYNEFRKAPEPDIRRLNVEPVILDLLTMGIEDASIFEFVDAPSEVIDDALIFLKQLSALDDTLTPTALGRQMAGCPLEPPLAKVLITSTKLGCFEETLTIVSVLSTQHQQLFYRDERNSNEIHKKKEQFHQLTGDHLTFLEIYDQWKKNEYSEEWCIKNFIQYRYLAEAKDIKHQLKDMMIKKKLLTPEGDDIFTCHPTDPNENIGKAFTAGFFFHLAKKNEEGYGYQKLSPNGEQKDVFLHPSSALFKQKELPEWIIFHEVMQTTKAFVIGAMVIQPQWLKEFAFKFVEEIENKYSIVIE